MKKLLNTINQNDQAEFDRILTKTQINLNTPYGLRNTYICIYAIARGTVEMVKAIIAAGADVNQRDQYGLSALMHASFDERLDILQALLDAGANVDLRDDKGRTALAHATRCYSNKSLILLMNAGADLNILDFNHLTLLHHAARRGSYNCVNHLLQFIDVNVRDRRMMTPLSYAVSQYFDNTKCIKILLDNGASVSTEVLKITNNLTLTLLQMFVDAGLRVNEPDEKGDLPINVISLKTTPFTAEYLRILIEAGSKVDSIGSDGRNPLQHAVEKDDHKAIDILMQNGADPRGCESHLLVKNHILMRRINVLERLMEKD